MAEDDHGLSEIEDIATALDEIKQMAKMMKNYLSDIIVTLSGILIDVSLGLFSYALYTIYAVTNQGTLSTSAIIMSKISCIAFLLSVRK